MEIQFSIPVKRSPSEVFQFIRDMRNHPQEEDSKVLFVEKVTEREIGLATQFDEVVRMFPFSTTRFSNEITRFEPDEEIEITWHGGWMEGILTFHLNRDQGVTILKVEETINLKGVMKWLEPIIEKNFRDMWEKRLQGIEQAITALS